jgi:thioredoxin
MTQSPRTISVTRTNFGDVVKRPGVVVLDFSARWCPPCRTFEPVFAAAAERRSEMTFGTVDTDAEPDLAVELDVRAQPTIVVFRDGNVVYKQVGAVSATKFEDLLERLSNPLRTATP